MENKPRRMHLDERILKVPFRIYEQRIAICKKCYAFNSDGDVCKIVNIPVATRTTLKSGSCPMGFWSSYYGD